MKIEENEFIPKIEQAKTLPEGWNWIQYNDGSGHLEAPDKKSYFSYDLAPYRGLEVEYKLDKETGWDVYCGNFNEFKEWAEYIISTKYQYREKDK